jgi:hypothetical protein
MPALREALQSSSDQSGDPLAFRLLEQRLPVRAAAEKLHKLVLGGGAEEPSDRTHEHLGFARQRDALRAQCRSPHDPQCSRIAACTRGNRDRSRRKASR